MAEMRSRPGGPPLHRFPGGLELPDNKAMATTTAIRTAPLPRELVVPLAQHIGDAAKSIAKIGQRVLRGEVIAQPEDAISVPVHSPTSGIVTAIEDRLIPHPSGLTARCVVIEPDGKDDAVEPQPLRDWKNAAPVEIRDHIRAAGIVGLGGAAFPTWVKLDARAPIERLILNGAECEPYISCDDMLMRERANDIVSGALIMLHALQAERCQLAIEDNKPEAEAALRDALATVDDERLELITVPSVYPEGGERQLIQVLTGQEVPHDGLPLDIGVICHNVATAAAVHRAAIHGETLISRVVTVTGRGVTQPANVEARIGTSFHDLIEFCGGYAEDVARLIMGGPMMGFAVSSDDIPLIKATNCILAGSATEAVPARVTLPCIRCGECAQVCPATLLPQTLYAFTRARDFEKVQAYDVFDCIECGCCDLVCPSQIPLVSHFRFAKTEIRGKEMERSKADLARQRFEFRQSRLQREADAQEGKRRRKQETLEKLKSSDSKKNEIQAALERARKKKEKQ
ncbi:MAG TPA: electron transport complex subunit RsxC [Gammaproteobacteria bacterium]